MAPEEHWKENGKTHLIISQKKEEKTARRKVQTSRFSSPPASERHTSGVGPFSCAVRTQRPRAGA